MNITDIDDKTIRDSQKEGKSLKEFTEFYTNEFYKDRDALNIVPADIYPKATDYIQEMVDIIEKLIEKGFAYKSEDGSVYFDIKKDNEYGKLAHLDMESLKSNASGRIKNAENTKTSQDLALSSDQAIHQGQGAVQTLIQSIEDLSDSNESMLEQVESSNKEVQQIMQIKVAAKI
jgi:cysteinyl-tRNA synthetase